MSFRTKQAQNCPAEAEQLKPYRKLTFLKQKKLLTNYKIIAKGYRLIYN
jgi:hypothetical protein